jgi:hypothetical protein
VRAASAVSRRAADDRRSHVDALLAGCLGKSHDVRIDAVKMPAAAQRGVPSVPSGVRDIDQQQAPIAVPNTSHSTGPAETIVSSVLVCSLENAFMPIMGA